MLRRQLACGRLLLVSDDNMFIKQKFSKELLAAIKPLNLRYMAQSDIGIADDPDLLRDIRESGLEIAILQSLPGEFETHQTMWI